MPLHTDRPPPRWTVEDSVTTYGIDRWSSGFFSINQAGNAVVLPRWTVGSIVTVPGGAHPSYAHGYYKRDNAFYRAWDPIAADRDGFRAWMKANVLDVGPEVFGRYAARAA